MKQYMFLLLGLLVLTTVPLVAQDEEGPAGFEFIVGPRLGVSYVFTTPEDFTDRVTELFPGAEYFPIYTLFGVNIEQRILLGNTSSHFAFQEMVLVGGLEQSMALPIGALLIGYRDASGFEFGMGPLINFAGVGVVFAIGWTISIQGVYVPIDISITLPNRERPAGISLTTGFNFKVRRKMSDTF